MESESPKKIKTGLLIGLIAGGVVLIASAIVLIILFTGKASITGPWHNTELNQQLRFHNDGTVVIHTEYGDFEATYLLDSKSSKGVISMNGKSIEFTFEDDRLLLTSEGVDSEFVRGEMKIVTAETTPAETSSTSPASETTSAEQTAALTATPTTSPAVTAAPTTEPAPTSDPALQSTPTKAPIQIPTNMPDPIATASPTPTTESIIIDPDLFIGLHSNPIFQLVSTPVTGTWESTTTANFLIVFYTDNTYAFYIDYVKYPGETYTYDPITCKGELASYGKSLPFTVSGDTLSWDNGLSENFTRQY